MQTDSGEQRRTVVVSGVPDVLPPSRMIDKLTIHFQSGRRSHGGDVEVVEYPTNMDGVAFVTFDGAEDIIITVTWVDTKAEQCKLLADAERVVRKERQIMTDNEFPEDYILTVFPFSRDVFFYVPSATVDLSIFGSNQVSLIESLQSAHRSLRFQLLLQERKISVEGPFSAVRALREDLICRASRLKSTASVQTVNLREIPLNPRIISHHGSVGSVSCSGSKAKQEPVGSSSLSTSQQSTGEASEVQSLLSKSKSKTENTSSRQRFFHEGLAGGSFWDSCEEEEELKTRSRLEMSTEYTTERVRANPRRAVEREIGAGIISFSSGPALFPPKQTSAEEREDDVSQKDVGLGRISASKTRGKNHLDFWCSSAEDSEDLTSSEVNSTFIKTGLKDVSTTSESNTDARATCRQNPEDIWVDLSTFRYAERFHKNELERYLQGVDMSVECVEGSDLMRISLTDEQTTKASSRIQEALENLKPLLKYWQSELRVHEISYDKANGLDKQKLMQICDFANFLFDDVLYIFKDSCITVIGPSVSSYLFYRRVEDRIDKLKLSL